jgi:hypothetical protein
MKRQWTEDFDMTSIPDTALRSEWGRRNGLKRQSYTGGIYWKKHNPNTSRCRCQRCMAKRAAK